MGFMDQFRPAQSSLAMLGNRFSSIRQAANGDASGLIAYMRQTNPEFDAFARSMQGKTPEQAFSEFGLDYSQFSSLL